MSQCIARVVSVDSDHVWVETDPHAAGCGNCDQPGGCHSGFFAQARTQRRYRVANRVDARLGDEVQLVTLDGAVFKSALLAYGLPTGLLVLGAALGQSLHGDLWAISGGLLGLAFGVVLLRQAEHRALEKSDKEPMLVLRKMDSTTCQFLEQK